MAKITLAFSVDSDTDADIVTWWDEMGEQGTNRSATIRAAIRNYKDTAGLTLGDIFNELGEIHRLLRNGTVVNSDAGAPETDREPADPLTREAQAALDALGMAK